jgi:hypothetical protein
MSSLERRLDNLEARQPGAALTPKLVVTGVCPHRGITSARWMDGSTIDRAEGETEAAFRERVTARSTIVFVDARYGG